MISLTGAMQRKVRVFLAVLLVFGALILMILSLSPLDRFRLGTAAHDSSGQKSAHRNHRLVHWLSFGGLAFLLALLTRGMLLRFVGLTGIIAFGALIEYLQSVIYSYSIETWDIRDDACGALAGFLGAFLFLAIKRAIQKPSVTMNRF